MNFNDFENEIYHNHPGSSFDIIVIGVAHGTFSEKTYVFNNHRIAQSAVNTLYHNGDYSSMWQEADYIWDDVTNTVAKDRDGIFVNPSWYLPTLTSIKNQLGSSGSLNSLPYSTGNGVINTYNTAQQNAATALSNAWAKAIGNMSEDEWQAPIKAVTCECGLTSLDVKAAKIKCRMHSTWCEMFDSDC